MAPTLAAQLAPLIGLDEATTAEQILPHLGSIQSANEIRNYLQTLLAPGAASQSFIQQYLQLRFPSAPAPTPASSSRPASRSGGTWGKPLAPPSTSSSRAASPAPQGKHHPSDQEKQLLEKAFAGAGGRVYIKKDEDYGGWGGGTAGKKGGKGSAAVGGSSRGASVGTGAPTPAAAPTMSSGLSAAPVASRPAIPSPSGPPPASTTATARGKGKGKDAEPELELSEQAAKELLEIDRALKGFEPVRPGKEPRRCFCQARQHPLSRFVPLCPTCSLVLCTLNRPSAPCPSCSHHPLLSPTLTASHIATLQATRDDLISRERSRVQREKAQEERERAAIRFPDLAAAGDAGYRGAGGGGAVGGINYAQHAGGGMSLHERIDRAYQTGVSLNGRSMAPPPSSSATGKVLRLDGKTGKVKIQTKVPKSAGASAKGKASQVQAEEKVVEAEVQDDGLVGWIDPDDDGVRGVVALSSTKAEELGAPPPGRVFANVTLEEGERPVYVEAGEVYDEPDGAEEEGKEKGAPVPSGLAEARKRAAIPGAAVANEEGKGRKRRGKGGGKKEAGRDVVV
ncbi:hypothetical protein JCM1840_005429 [Sporobolomyces johnsonii]